MDRKQNPTKKWLKELLYRARIVENQLYKTAPSLKAYLDETTLKYRVKKAAHTTRSSPLSFELARENCLLLVKAGQEPAYPILIRL